MRHQTERQQVFEYMMDNNGFRTALLPLLRRFRTRERQRAYHPYQRSTSPSSPTNSEPITGTISVVIHDMGTTPIESPPITQTSSSPNTPENNDDDPPTSSTTTEQFSPCEPTCSQCLHQGHEAYDCDNGQPTELVETTLAPIDVIERQNSQEATTSQDDSPSESFHTAEDELPGSSPNHPSLSKTINVPVADKMGTSTTIATPLLKYPANVKYAGGQDKLNAITTNRRQHG